MLVLGSGEAWSGVSCLCLCLCLQVVTCSGGPRPRALHCAALHCFRALASVRLLPRYTSPTRHSCCTYHSSPPPKLTPDRKARLRPRLPPTSKLDFEQSDSLTLPLNRCRPPAYLHMSVCLNIPRTSRDSPRRPSKAHSIKRRVNNDLNFPKIANPPP